MSQGDFDKKINSLISRSVDLIHHDELAQMINSGKEVVLLDTRTKPEYEISHIPSALFIDYDRFSKKMVNKIDKEATVVVYCSVGYRSEKIGEKLKSMGFKNVTNLYGGIFDWKNNDHTVQNTKAVETDSVHTYNKNWSKWLEKGVKVYE